MRLFLVMGLLFAAASAARAEKGAFVVRAGSDTIAVENFERAEGVLSGDLVFRIMGVRFLYRLDPERAGVREMQVSAVKVAAAPDAAPLQTATLQFVGDSAFVHKSTGAPERLGTRAGARPYLNPSFALVEDLVRAASRGDGTFATVATFMVAGGSTVDVTITALGADSLRLEMAGQPLLLRVDRDGRVQGASIPAQGITVQRVDAPVVLASDPLPDYSAPAGAPYTAEDVAIRTPGGFTLAGTLTRPLGAKGLVPAVVTISGSGQQDRDETISLVRGYRPFRQIADTLARRGIAVLRLDDRGVGGSGGELATATTRDFADDVRAALAWLRTQRGIDGRRLALLGHSEGGIIAPLVAADDRALRGIVLMAGPAWNGRRILRYQLGRAAANGALAGAAADSARRAVDAEIDTMVSGSAWTRFFVEHDPLPVARRVKTPVLVLQGATDHQVTPEQAPVLAQAFRDGGNRDVTEHTFPDMNHLFLPDPDGTPSGYMALPVRALPAAVLGTIADWLATHLR